MEMSRERTVSPTTSTSSISELFLGVIMDKERTISPIGSISSVSEPFLDFSMEIESTISPTNSITSVPAPLFDINMDKTIPTQKQATPSLTDKNLGTDTILNGRYILYFNFMLIFLYIDQIADTVDLTTLVSLRLNSQAVIRPVPIMELSTGKQEQGHQLTACIDKEASVDGMIMCILYAYVWMYSMHYKAVNIYNS